MPIYEFTCQQCQSEFELLVPRQNWDGALCPHCGSHSIEKKFSTFSSSTSQGGASCGDCDSCPNPGRSHHHHGGCCGGCCCH